MPRSRAAYLSYTGFKQIPHRGAGLQKLHNRVKRELMWDRRTDDLVALRPWDADVKTEAKLVERRLGDSR
jgi:hypothetical protein